MASATTPLSRIHAPPTLASSSAGTKPSPPITITQRRLLSLNRRTVRLIMPALRSAPASPEGISEKVSESIKKAEEACEGDPKSGECAAAWDEVEELSAAASHARDRAKTSSDPLENYCQDNPETRECRTYED